MSEVEDVKEQKVEEQDVQFITVMFHYICLEMNE